MKSKEDLRLHRERVGNKFKFNYTHVYLFDMYQVTSLREFTRDAKVNIKLIKY